MKAAYEAERGDEIDGAGDTAIRLRVLAGEIYNAKCELEYVKRQLFLPTAGGEYLDYLAELRGLSRREALRSYGTLTFITETTSVTPIFIPKGTTVATDGAVPVRFRTTEDTELPAMTFSVTVAAESEEPGYSGNIAVGAATVPVSVPVGIDKVRNPVMFRGGDDAESDDSLRERVEKSIRERPNGMNAAYYREVAESVDGVDKAGIVERVDGGYTVGVYLLGRGGTVSNSVLAAAREAIEQNRGVNVTVTVGRATSVPYDLDVTVTAKSGYSADEVRAAVAAAFASYLKDIGIGGRFYLSQFGKYIMDTGCVENYELGQSMSGRTLLGSQYFEVGDVNIGVN